MLAKKEDVDKIVWVAQKFKYSRCDSCGSVFTGSVFIHPETAEMIQESGCELCIIKMVMEENEKT